MQVLFNEPDEFIEELRKEYPDPYGGQPILRITGLTKRTNPNMAQLYICATIINARGEVLKLERQCGTLWPIATQEGDKAKKAYEAWFNALEVVARELNLEVRSGVFEGGTLEK